MKLTSLMIGFLTLKTALILRITLLIFVSGSPHLIAATDSVGESGSKAYRPCTQLMIALMRPELDQILSDRLMRGHNDRDLPTERVLSVGNRTYKLSAFLGKGGEGRVYLGSGLDGTLVAVKIFKGSRQSVKDSIASLIQLKESGFDVVKIVAIDYEKGILVQEYIEGLSTLDMLNERKFKKNSDFKSFLEALRQDLKTASGDRIHAGNVILEFKTGRVVVIDPY